MELRLITDQGGDFESYFATVSFNRTWCGRIERQQRLLQYLQTQVPGPAQWVGVSDLLSLSFGDVDSWQPKYRRVKVSARRSDAYEVPLHHWANPLRFALATKWQQHVSSWKSCNAIDTFQSH